MRVRLFELRLIAGGLSILWALAAGLVLTAYRPGGPIDLLVGVAACTPIAIAIAGLVWPPVARSDHAFAGIVWLGLGAALLLVPSIGGIVNQILARGSQTLLPSLEAGYSWLLALLATSLFAGLGLARRMLGGTALRRERLVRGVAIAVMATAASSSLFVGVAIANDLALRDRPAISSRFGPTDASLQPPACDGPIVLAPDARLGLDLDLDVDGRPAGAIQIAGLRHEEDVRWTGEVASDLALGGIGRARLGDRAWSKAPREGWRRIAVEQTADDTLDRLVLATALAPENRTAAEERGLEFVEGARSRHCRIAVDGPTFVAAFPAIEWLVGHPDLHRWRGQLDYWVFADGQLGQVRAAVNGEAASIGARGLQANLRAWMIATDRDRHAVVSAPGD